MSDPTIKNIQLTGGVGTEMGDTRKKGRKSKSKTYKIDRAEGGGSTSPGTLTQLAASSIPGSLQKNSPAPVGINSPLTAAGSPLQAAGSTLQTAGKSKDVSAVATNSATPMKVVLAAAKKKGRIILAAAKPILSPAKTKKVSHTKKVRVTISNLGKKIHKAKEIRKVATESTIDDIKKTLHKAGLIKEGSKAPDTILRQMYADFMTLKGRAL